jgi:1-acyl-sn-glycerol-3-phosphate acyltransferase
MRPFLYEGLGDLLIRPLVRTLYRLEVAGGDRIPARGPGILVANHDSVLDPFVLGCATPRVVHFMAKAELWRSRAVGFLMDAFGSFPVERAAGDRSAVARAAELLRAGELVAVFPQGTALPFRRKPYARGAARLALQTGAPLVPTCLVGTERAVRPHRVRIGFPRVLVLVGRPIRVEPQRATVVAAKALTARIEETIEELRRPYGPPAHAWIDETR